MSRDLTRLSKALRALLACDSDDFADLARASGLNPETDFRNANLSGADLRGSDLRDFNFCNAIFVGAAADGALFNDTVTGDQLTEMVGRAHLTECTAPNILVLHLGPRAEEIARHVTAPDWRPVLTSEDRSPWRYTVTRETFRLPGSRVPRRPCIHIAPGEGTYDIGGFDVVVIVADDDDVANISASDMFAGSAPRLLVPALPRDRPSAVLAGELPLSGSFHGVVDVSLARSPYWSGNPWRALERRIADMAVGAAMLVSADERLREGLASPRGVRPQLLTFGFGDPASETALERLASETAGVPGPVRTTVTFKAVWTRQKPSGGDRGLACVIPFPVRAPEMFLAAAAQKAVALKTGAGVIGLAPAQVPASLRRDLMFPDLAAGVQARGLPVAVVAETPTLDLVQRAAQNEWRLTRYTDVEFLGLAVVAGDGGRQLPDEITLGSPRRRRENRRMATRGVDPRDVVELPEALRREIEKRTPELAGELRLYRSAFHLDGEPTWLLPTSAVTEFLSGAAAVRHTLRGALATARAAKPPVPKRPADLRIAWACPPHELNRFIVADGPLPARLAVLPPHEVPAQSLFIVDGDAAVPALLQSPVFETWARVTTSRSISWMRRFSVSRTFETFPIVPPFTLLPLPSGTAISLGGKDAEMKELAERWMRELIAAPSGEADTLARRSPEAAHIRARLDELVLRAYGLEPRAGDIAIIERLFVLTGVGSGGG